MDPAAPPRQETRVGTRAWPPNPRHLDREPDRQTEGWSAMILIFSKIDTLSWVSLP
jgi:hypothetical protein